MTELDSIQVLHERFLVEPISEEGKGTNRGRVVKISPEKVLTWRDITEEGEGYKGKNVKCDIKEGSVVYYKATNSSYYSGIISLSLEGKEYHLLERQHVLAIIE